MPTTIRYATAADGVSVARREAGEGPVLLKIPAAPFSHLGEDADAYGRSEAEFERNFHVVCWDPRGVGMSQRDVREVSLETLHLDALAVIAAAKLDRFAVDDGTACWVLPWQFGWHWTCPSASRTSSCSTRG